MCNEVPHGKRHDTGVLADKQLPQSYHYAIQVRLIYFFVVYISRANQQFPIFDWLIDFSGDNWLGVGLDQFMACDSNLATNRQTRMLSDLSLIGCYNKSAMPSQQRDRTMLASAKRNLVAMSYFGLTEYQKVQSPHQFLTQKTIFKNVHFFFFFFASLVCRFLNMCLRKHLIYVLPYHSISIIQLCPVQRWSIYDQSNDTKWNSWMHSILSCMSLRKKYYSKDLKS